MTPTLPGLSAFTKQRTILDKVRGLGAQAPQADPEPFPVEVPIELVAEIVARFPSDCPRPGPNAAEQMTRRQGQREVIEFLARVSIDQHPQDFGGS